MKVAKISLLVIVGLMIVGCCVLIFHKDKETVELETAPISLDHTTSDSINYTDFINIDKLTEKNKTETVEIGDTGYEEINEDLSYISSDETDKYTCYDNTSVHNAKNYYRKSTMNINVLFVDYPDCAVYNDAENVSVAKECCNDMKSYYATMSRGHLTMTFNYYYYNNTKDTYSSLSGNPLNYINQFQINQRIYNEGMQNAITLEVNHNSTPDVRIIIHSVKEAGDYSSIFWPKVDASDNQNSNSDLMIMNSIYLYPSVFIHEMGHALGFNDLYSVSGSVDLVSDLYTSIYPEDSVVSQEPSNGNLMDHAKQWTEDENTVVTTMNAQNRFLLGWLGDVGIYNENSNTPIQKITQTKTNYVLQPNTSQNGAICYKFGQNGNEFFLIENSDFVGERYLKISRINMNKNSNWLATNESKCYIYSVRDQNRSVMGTSESYFGGDNSAIRYADGTKANFMISNIKINSDKTISFDFYVGNDIPTTTPEVVENTNSFEAYFNILDGNNEFIEISQVGVEFYREDGFVGSFTFSAHASVVYVGNEKYYYVHGEYPEGMKTCKLYAFYNDHSFIIDTSQKYTTVRYEKSFGDIFTDTVDNIKRTIFDIFGNIFA